MRKTSTKCDYCGKKIESTTATGEDTVRHPVVSLTGRDNEKWYDFCDWDCCFKFTKPIGPTIVAGLEKSQPFMEVFDRLNFPPVHWSGAARKLLLRCKIQTWDDLMSKTDAELLAYPGCSPRVFDEIKNTLTTHGFSLSNLKAE